MAGFHPLLIRQAKASLVLEWANLQEVSVPQTSPLSPFLANIINPIFHFEWVKAKNLMNRKKGDQKDTRTT